MLRAKRNWLALATICVSFTAAKAAHAQTSPRSQAQQPPANASAPARPGVSVSSAASPSGGNITTPPSLALQLQRSGGSLARVELATAAMQVDPSTPGLAATSFFAVPAPQPKLVHKHDIVVVIVNEQSNFTSNGLTDLKHSSDVNAEIDSYLAFRLSNLRIAQITPSNPLDVKGSGARDFKGEATVNRSDALTTQISAEVIDVKPNGTVVLKATTHIKNDEEEQTIELTGNCRVEDITADNSVLSTQLSGLDVKKTHTGAVRDTTERGFIPRLLDTINPF